MTERPQSASSAACAAAAAPPLATADTPAPRSSGARRGRGKSGCDDNRIADIAPTNPHPLEHVRVLYRLAALVALRRSCHQEQRAGSSRRETTLPAIRNL